MEYNIVTNYKNNQTIKSKSKYFTVNLGLASTKESKSGDRLLNTGDDFAYFYNTKYRTTILGQGNIGNIKFYTDHYITTNQLAFYYDKEEFIFEFDDKMVSEKGVDFYLGHLIKTIETEFEDRIQKEKDIEEEKKNGREVGDPNKVLVNPGNVKYSDLKAYLDKIRSERLKS